jgi:hypothetical protein
MLFGYASQHPCWLTISSGIIRPFTYINNMVITISYLYHFSKYVTISKLLFVLDYLYYIYCTIYI